MSGGYRDFDERTAEKSTREFKITIFDVKTFVAFMEWARKEAKKNGAIGYLAARNEARRYLVQCVYEKAKEYLSSGENGNDDH